MIDTGCALESPAMRSSEAATGTRTTMPACSISTTIGPTTTTTTLASADPTLQHLDAGHAATEGSILVESIPQDTAKARQQAKPKTAAAPTGAVVESGVIYIKIKEIRNGLVCNVSTAKSQRRKSTVYIKCDTQKDAPSSMGSKPTRSGKETRLCDVPSILSGNSRHLSHHRSGALDKRRRLSDFNVLTSLENLYSCWLKSKRSKGNSLRIQRFDADALGYLTTIQQRLRSRTYTFGPYKTFTVREKKFRDVVDAPTKDRVVHWMLYQYLLPIWQPRFIHDTFGNLLGRGSHAAVNRVAQFTRRESNTWALQLDISKYFYSVPHAQLKERALRYIGDHDIRQLIISLIESYRTGNNYDDLFAPDSLYRTNPDKGIPIGNLSSQLFANIYLNEFDHWLKETLQVKHYVRYVDDMVILGSSKEQLQQLCQIITDRLSSEGITIHPKKIRIAPTAAGIPFLGYIIWPHHISAGAYLRTRFIRTLRQHESQIYDRSQALNSYRAALAHTGATA